MQLIFECLLLLVGVYWCGTAVFTLPLWRGTSIAGGLLPTFASGVMILLLIYRIVTEIRSGKVNKSYFVDSFKEIDWRCLVPILIGISVVIGTHIIGLFLSLTVMLFCWLKFLSSYSVAKSLTITVCVMAVLYGIFKAWLIVPLPKGLLNFI